MVYRIGEAGFDPAVVNVAGVVDVEVGLFDDSIDALAEGDGFSDITTEPDGTDYSPQTVTAPDVSQDGDGVTTVDMGNLSFNVSDATTDADYVYVQDSVSGDLIFTNALDQSYDLGSIDTLDLSNVGMELE